MSKLEQLIAELCPDGVEYKSLGQLGSFYGGLTGKSKEDFSDGNAKFITYLNVFKNLEIDTNMPERVKVGANERQNTVLFGDVIFTGSSETPDECGMSAVLASESDEPLYLNSFCFGFRFHDSTLFLPGFSKYVFRSDSLRKQIGRTANGVTRFNVSKEKMKKVIVPLPPLPVQREIVRILDNFTELTAELTAELTGRKKQYEYYRNELLTFGDDVPMVSLCEVAEYPTYRINADDVDEDNYVGVDNLLPEKRGKTASSYVPVEGRLNQFLPGDVLIGNIRPYLKKVWLADVEGGTNGDVLVVRGNSQFIPRFLYFLLSSDSFFRYDMQHAKGAKMPRGSKDAIMQYIIPLPPLGDQARIVAILDKFDALTTDITVGLPAEIAARQKQYEYYRDKILTFKEQVG